MCVDFEGATTMLLWSRRPGHTGRSVTVLARVAGGRRRGTTLGPYSDRLARFEREAKVLALVNHPGIAAIYGLEEADSTKALVLELVEGPTLADRMKQEPIPLDGALPRHDASVNSQPSGV